MSSAARLSQAALPGLNFLAWPHPGDLTTLRGEVRAMTSEVGANTTPWPGLTAYRFSSPQRPRWRCQAHCLTICFVVQGGQRVATGEREYAAAAPHVLFFLGETGVRTEVVRAEPARPYLCLDLAVDPAVVSSISADLPPAVPASLTAQATAEPSADATLGSAVLRFLRSLIEDGDRRVLAPMYLREIVYRLMTTASNGDLVRAVARAERSSDPVSRAVAYMRSNLAEPVTVIELAQHAMVSASALNAAFGRAFGTGPHRYLKRMRLNRAAHLLAAGGHNVDETAHHVGYASTSHFIKDFKRHFGATPRKFANAHPGAAASTAVPVCMTGF
uniref:AraC family transcriptional regulator n=1 Tax=Paractinoplanes polyasparticus TaxID=2856853 RepID=UPI001C85FCAF|nr:AraC family transcriptional regulator [Actinoplanes polyasparticus]